MTPEEKGDEFIEKYWNQVWHNLTPVNHNPKLKDGSNNALLEQATKCSIIAVEEIIKAIDFDWMEVQNLDRINNYWNEVLNYLKSKL